MKSKRITTLGAVLPLLVASPMLNAAPPEGDLEPLEVGAFLEHAEDIVRTIKGGMKNCVAKDDTITCTPKSAPPMTCKYETVNHPDSITVDNARLLCETDGRDFAIEPVKAWYGPFYKPRNYDSPDVRYTTPTSGEFEIWPPSYIFSDFGTCMAALQRPINNDDIWINPWHGCTQAQKIASGRINRQAIGLLNKAARMADEARDPAEPQRHYGFVIISAPEPETAE